MPPTIRRMLSEPSLPLALLVEGRSLDQPIQWIHSSDLTDPTPFLDERQMLLTTGTQFHEAAVQSDYDRYVTRLVQHGVVALGFGADVIRTGTPTELTGACAEFGLALVEVPYRTPFIAIVRWAADVIAKELHERVDWSLRAQRAISLAALGQRGLAGVLVTLARQLECRVAVFEPGGTFDAVISPDEFADQELDVLSAEAVRLLRAGKRSASSIALEGQPATLQTLGPRDRLGGVLAIVGARNPDSAAQAVMTSAVALAEISLEESRIRRGSLMPLHGELFSLLLAGQADVVLRAIPDLPRAELRVVLCRPETQSQWFIEAVVRHTSIAGSRLFLAPYAGNLVVLVSDAEWAGLKSFLADNNVSTGASNTTELECLASGLAQAKHALEFARREGRTVTEFSTVSDSAFVDIIAGPRMADLATARLSRLLAENQGREHLASASVWLAHNGAWDSAAKELGLHRHTLKARVEKVATTLGLSLDRFADRAQLWSLLTALDFDAGTVASGPLRDGHP